MNFGVAELIYEFVSHKGAPGAPEEEFKIPDFSSSYSNSAILPYPCIVLINSVGLSKAFPKAASFVSGLLIPATKLNYGLF